MKKITNTFLTTFGLVCRIPLPCKYEVDYSLFGLFLPWIGIFVTALNYGIFHITIGITGDYFLSALFILFIQYLAFNLFHFDGLLDSADALFCYADREKRIAILKDIQIGSFAFFIGIFYLIAKIYLLMKALSLAAGSLPLTLFVLSYPVAGRIASVLIPLATKPAKEKGLGALLKNSSKPASVIGPLTVLGGLFAVLYISGLFVPIQLTILSAPLISALLIGFQYQRKIGGYTGDALGFSIELGELIQLFVIFLLLYR